MPEKIKTQTLLAEEMVSGVQYLTRRDVLTDISSPLSPAELCCEKLPPSAAAIEWMKVEQVGVEPGLSAHRCYTAMQKALFSCHRPGHLQVIYLVHGDGEKVNLYIGVRNIAASHNVITPTSFAESLSAYLCNLLHGSRVRFICDMDAVGNGLLERICDYHSVHALTGIPSLMSGAGEEGLSSIDTLVGPLCRKCFAYLVVANPVSETTVSSVMTRYLGMAGSIESLKSLNVSQAVSETVSVGRTQTLFNTVSESTTDTLTDGLNMGVKGISSYTRQMSQAMMRGQSEGHSQGEQRGISQGHTATASRTLVNKCADYAAGLLTQHAERYRQGLGQGMWETGIYLLTEDVATGRSTAMQLRSVVSGSKSFLDPIRTHDLSRLMNKRGVSGNMREAFAACRAPQIVVRTPDGETVKSGFDMGDEHLTTVLTTEELSYIVNMPQKSVPGVSLVPYSDGVNLTPQLLPKGAKGVALGKMLYSGSPSNIGVSLPLDTLSRHALVCGVNGSGKTNTVLNLLEGFMHEGRPFLVIEPAKTEYVDWALDYNAGVRDQSKKIKVFMPGCDYYAKKRQAPSVLRINPFEVIDLGGNEPRVLSHIDRLKASLAAAFPMQDILPVVLEHLLYRLYTDAGMMDKEDKGYMNSPFPTLSKVNKPLINALMLELGYAAENTQNITAALRTRFNSLKHGWKGELLNNERLYGMTWHDLFGSPCVVNLSYAGDDQDRAFIMSLILQFLYEYRIAETETRCYSFNDNACRHLVVVEEAHRVMGRCADPQLPQYRSGQMFSNFLSEVRAYGQGMMVVDQVPSRLIEDAVKNTNIKIIHKLVAADDARTLADSIGLAGGQQSLIPRLSVGQALLVGLNSASVAGGGADIYLAQINKKK